MNDKVEALIGYLISDGYAVLKLGEHTYAVYDGDKLVATVGTPVEAEEPISNPWFE